MQESLKKEKVQQPIRNHPDSIYAGAIGAALWGAFRYERLARKQALGAVVLNGMGSKGPLPLGGVQGQSPWPSFLQPNLNETP